MSALDPPFRAEQVGSLLRPDAVHRARAQRAAGAITAAAAARRRGRGDRRRRPAGRVARDAQRHRRRVPPGVVPPRLPRAARRRRRHRQHRRQLGRRRHRPHDAAAAGRRRAAAPRPRHPGRRLPLPAVGRDADAEGVDPVADDGPLPRRAGGDRPRRLPRPRAVLRRPRRLLPGRDRRPVRRRLPLPPARRHQPRLPVRSR